MTAGKLLWDSGGNRVEGKYKPGNPSSDLLDLIALLALELVSDPRARLGRRSPPHRSRAAHFAMVDFDARELEQAAEVARADKVFPSLEDPGPAAEEEDKTNHNDGVVWGTFCSGGCQRWKDGSSFWEKGGLPTHSCYSRSGASRPGKGKRRPSPR